ncbi:hypothetical protein BCR36DRAFT_583690 [Piromyces finnis]|uniref:Glycosyltransferase family 17 protein n=1 Tax=Piromyces finnis TaxID=1754191 RepID=A0A1Y1V870_9FUNG|nr:hypothetical protein BCR36DRAFT_583690 [Piromyces finnis]|eukprot:ORX49601.1 hypothetical protein BCR36DRAFT_583690 [Piromyces finnis]
MESLSAEEYILLEDIDENNPDSKTTFITKKKESKSKKIIKIIIIIIIIISCLIISFFAVKTFYNNDKIIVDEEHGFSFIKGEPRIDKYGIDLNINILEGMYSKGIDDDINKSIEDWSLYTPPCPNLRPVKHSEYIMNPKCKDISLQFHNYENKKVPLSLSLNDISDQMKKYEEWKKNNNTNPYYGRQDYKHLLSEEFHPYDYGYDINNAEINDDTEYYSQVVKSRMDEVPDPRKRRLFSFILFNSEFDLLDLYISEYYDIVDYFVIFESNSTFSNEPKPLYFTKTLLETNRYDKFKDKLIPLPLALKIEGKTEKSIAFAKEHLARRLVIEKGLESVQARHGDLFIHGDLDEMPKAHVISRLKKCGGWEHLQSGIGGRPKSFKYENAESYLVNENMHVEIGTTGEYQVDYVNERSLGFLSWFYEYSFNLVQSEDMATATHPNIIMFDARRALGQIPENKNYKRSDYDPLLDPNFNPYKGYIYNITNTDKWIGKGFIAELLRFDTSDFNKLMERKRPVLWNGGWHMSSFLPTIDQFYNKVKSYSHYDLFSGDEESDKKQIIYRIKQHEYIFGSEKKYYDRIPSIPSSYTKGYDYNLDYSYWKENTNNFDENGKFNEYLRSLDNEVPIQVLKNPICYSYMLDRDFGFEKKLWWQVVPKEDWNKVRLEELDSDSLNEITPAILSDEYKTEMFKEMAKENKESK